MATTIGQFLKDASYCFVKKNSLIASMFKVGEQVRQTFTTEVMNLPVRIADPLDSFQMPPGRNDCEYTTASGIIRYIMNKERNPYRYIEAPIEVLRSGGVPAFIAAKRGGHHKNPKSVNGEGFRHFLEMVKKSMKELF